MDSGSASDNVLRCQTCCRVPSARLPFLCITCSRTRIYGPRLQHLQVLLDKERHAEAVTQVVADADGSRRSGGSTSDRSSAQSYAVLQQLQTQAQTSRQRQAKLQADVDDMHSIISRLKSLVADQRKWLLRRRAAAEESKRSLEKEEDQTLAPLLRQAPVIETRWNRLHIQTAEARVLLCREVANLYGLQQRRKGQGSSGKDAFQLGGVPLVDLRDLNHATPEQVNVSMAFLAHLLHLIAHYLSLRLPAEISLPTAESTVTVIHTPLSSYKTPALAFSRTHTAASAGQDRRGSSHPRERLLHLEKPLSQLATEDARAASLFIDAVTLLAWNTAWLAKTQGVDVGARSWEEVCSPGHILWTLFVAPPPALSGRAGQYPKDTVHDPANAQGLTTALPNGITRFGIPITLPSSATATTGIAAPSPGHLAHGTVHSFLSAAGPSGGADYMANWRFASPVRLIERMKHALANERTGAEWELLEGDELAQAHNDAGEEQRLTSAGPLSDKTTDANKARPSEAARNLSKAAGLQSSSRVNSNNKVGAVPSNPKERQKTTVVDEQKKQQSSTGASPVSSKKGWTKIRNTNEAV